MTETRNNFSIQIDFEDTAEAAWLLSSIASIKHGDESDKRLDNIVMLQKSILSLAKSIDNNLHKPEISQINRSRLNENDEIFKKVKQKLIQRINLEAFERKWPEDKLQYAAKWVQCYFAPYIIDIELAQKVAREIGLISK